MGASDAIVVEFRFNGFTLGEREFASVEDLPEEVDFHDVRYSTFGTDRNLKTASQWREPSSKDGRRRFTVNVVRADL